VPQAAYCSGTFLRVKHRVGVQIRGRNPSLFPQIMTCNQTATCSRGLTFGLYSRNRCNYINYY